MSHIAEVYAKDLGVKIGKPQLNDHFFPVVPEKYVIMNAHSNIQAHNYDFWSIVLDLISPYLEKENIVMANVADNDALSLNQKNHLIKRSELVFGIFNHYAQVADIYGVPSVCVLSNIYPENCKTFNNSTILSPDFSEVKPCFAANDPLKRINEIKPEVIAQEILDKLNIKEKINFKTIRAGEYYNKDMVEIVPDFFGYSEELRGKQVNLRADLHFDTQNIFDWCNMCLVNIVTEEVLPQELLMSAKNNIKQLTFKMSDLSVDQENFFKLVKRLGIQLVIITENEDIITDMRLKYFDYTVVLDSMKKDILEIVNENTKFLSKKRFISKAEVFPSYSSFKRLDKSNKFVYDNTSSKELEELYLYE